MHNACILVYFGIYTGVLYKTKYNRSMNLDFNGFSFKSAAYMYTSNSSLI